MYHQIFDLIVHQHQPTYRLLTRWYQLSIINPSHRSYGINDPSINSKFNDSEAVLGWIIHLDGNKCNAHTYTSSPTRNIIVQLWRSSLCERVRILRYPRSVWVLISHQNKCPSTKDEDDLCPVHVQSNNGGNSGVTRPEVILVQRWRRTILLNIVKS